MYFVLDVFGICCPMSTLRHSVIVYVSVLICFVGCLGWNVARYTHPNYCANNNHLQDWLGETGNVIVLFSPIMMFPGAVCIKHFDFSAGIGCKTTNKQVVCRISPTSWRRRVKCMKLKKFTSPLYSCTPAPAGTKAALIEM